MDTDEEGEKEGTGTGGVREEMAQAAVVTAAALLSAVPAPLPIAVALRELGGCCNLASAEAKALIPSAMAVPRFSGHIVLRL